MHYYIDTFDIRLSNTSTSSVWMDNYSSHYLDLILQCNDNARKPIMDWCLVVRVPDQCLSSCVGRHTIVRIQQEIARYVYTLEFRL